jgi:putative ABC transport system permease protein
MTRHLLRLIWNRRWHNALLIVEIFCSFLVLFGVVLLLVQYASNYRQPLGYDISRAWVIEVSVHVADQGPGEGSGHGERFRQLLAGVGELPQIEAVTAGFTTPYANASWESGMRYQGRQIDYGVNQVTDTFPQVVGLRLIAGRWFGREDDGAAARPIVVNARLARELFGTTDVAGRTVRRDPEPNFDRMSPEERADAERELRIVGVIEDFRQHGEYSTPMGYMFQRIDLNEPDGVAPRTVMIKLQPGTSAAFEEALVERMHALAPDWSFEVKPLDQLRREKLRMYLTPLIAVGTVAAFLLVMVALGLTGVVWQNVTQRSREIGLRRAKGATRAGVYRQFLTELAILTSMALALGLTLVAQGPLLPLPRELQLVSGGVFATAVLLSVVAIYALTLCAGWYPSRLSMRVEPAEALRYE